MGSDDFLWSRKAMEEQAQINAQVRGAGVRFDAGSQSGRAFPSLAKTQNAMAAWEAGWFAMLRSDGGPNSGANKLANLQPAIGQFSDEQRYGFASVAMQAGQRVLLHYCVGQSTGGFWLAVPFGAAGGGSVVNCQHVENGLLPLPVQITYSGITDALYGNPSNAAPLNQVWSVGIVSTDPCLIFSDAVVHSFADNGGPLNAQRVTAALWARSFGWQAGFFIEYGVWDGNNQNSFVQTGGDDWFGFTSGTQPPLPTSQQQTLPTWTQMGTLVLDVYAHSGQAVIWSNVPPPPPPDWQLTLSSGATTFEKKSHPTSADSIMKITGDAGGNTIATITGGILGDRLDLVHADALVTYTDDNSHAADTLDLSAAYTSAPDSTLSLRHDGTSWYETSRSVN